MNQSSVSKGSLRLFEAFKEELFRWNQQINLVSRQETKDRLDGLFSQCIGGVGAVGEILENSQGPSPSCLYYFDLGSGGGLPGVIWHILFSDRTNKASFLKACPVKTWLVEPREKRAWFLNRLNRIPEVPSFDVLHGRWGDVSLEVEDFQEPEGGCPLFVISLKALHLDDHEVIGGLFAAVPALLRPVRLVVVRYYPPLQLFDRNLKNSLKLSSKETNIVLEGWRCQGLGAGVVDLKSPGVGLASLVFSSYEIQENA